LERTSRASAARRARPRDGPSNPSRTALWFCVAARLHELRA
jgi:hypothetical protein